jgi:predicted DNA-binding transcriptional regulator AlpA
VEVATVYSLLAVAESLGATAHGNPPPQPHGELAPRRAGDTDKDLLTAQDVAHMTGLSVHTLSWWRFNGGPGPTHLKLGRRVFYRRTEVEQWLAQAGSGEGT